MLETINMLTKYYTAPKQQCREITDQMAHQLLHNGKRNNDHIPQKQTRPKQDET